MQWLYLITAGLLETVWAVSLKYSQGFSKIVPSVVTVVGMVASFFFLSMALKQLPLGTAYAIWTGIGMTGTFILGILLFHEQVAAPQIFCVALILIGIVGLKLLTAAN